MPKTENAGPGASKGTSSTPATSYNGIGRVRNEIINEVTDDYISHLSANPSITPEQIEKDLLKLYEESINLENGMRSRGMVKYTAPTTLPSDIIAQLMAHVYNLRRISCAGVGGNEEYDLIGIYMEDGPNKGIYSTSDIDLAKAATRFNRRLKGKDMEDILFSLKHILPRCERCMDRDLIAVNNGIFDYRTKQLMPFTPDLVFMAKSHVDYNPNATNVVIHNDEDGTDWDVESWIKEISVDEEIEDLLWEIIGAVVRPYVRWNKSAWLYAEDGMNGKGTFCEMIQNLCGDGTYAAIPLASFSKEFAMEPLIHATTIIAHENSPGKFIDDVANLKAVITNDVIPINRKHKQIISFQFYGFMVQCLNDMPKIRDKSDSFYRRQLFVPFNKTYVGVERKYIKEDYITRKEVLEYVLLRVLNMNYYELSNPASCRRVLEEYKEFNDPVRQFMNELGDQFTWDLLPFQFLYDLYKAWFQRNVPSGTLQGKNKFIQELLNVIKKDNQWSCPDKSKNIRSDKKMVGPEPLIYEYELTNWFNKNYKGSDPKVISTIVPNAFYRGILRVKDGEPLPDDAADNTAVETEGTK